MVGIGYPQISPANVLLLVWSFLGSDLALVKPPFYTTGRQPTGVEFPHKRWGGFPAVSGVAWRRFRSDVPYNDPVSWFMGRGPIHVWWVFMRWICSTWVCVQVTPCLSSKWVVRKWMTILQIMAWDYHVSCPIFSAQSPIDLIPGWWKCQRYLDDVKTSRRRDWLGDIFHGHGAHWCGPEVDDGWPFWPPKNSLW